MMVFLFIMVFLLSNLGFASWDMVDLRASLPTVLSSSPKETNAKLSRTPFGLISPHCSLHHTLHAARGQNRDEFVAFFEHRGILHGLPVFEGDAVTLSENALGRG